MFFCFFFPCHLPPQLQKNHCHQLFPSRPILRLRCLCSCSYTTPRITALRLTLRPKCRATREFMQRWENNIYIEYVYRYVPHGNCPIASPLIFFLNWSWHQFMFTVQGGGDVVAPRRLLLCLQRKKNQSFSSNNSLHSDVVFRLLLFFVFFLLFHLFHVLCCVSLEDFRQHLGESRVDHQSGQLCCSLQRHVSCSQRAALQNRGLLLQLLS